MKIITNNIPEFTMPEPVTLEQQISLLNQRILELEKELQAQKSTTDLYWDDNGNCLGESLGIDNNAERELSRILQLWVNKHQGSFPLVYKEIITCPLPYPEKLLMFSILAASQSQPKNPRSPSPMSPEEFFKKVFGGGR